MKRFWFVWGAVLASVAALLGMRATRVSAQQPPPAAPQTVTVPEIPFDSQPEFLKYSADMNLGEVLGVAVNSKGRIVVLNHPGIRHLLVNIS